MMKFLFDKARKSEKTASFSISFFFNARGDTLEKSVFGMYRSLLHQMLKHFSDLQALLDDPDIVPLNSDDCPSLDVLKDLFQTAISRLGSRTLTCFVDALDEGDEQQIIDMVQFFEEIAEQSAENGVRFKTCLSSRHYPYIDVRYGLRVSLEDQDGHKDDLCKYVRDKLRIKDMKMLEDLEAQLVEKSQGVFLWLELVVDILIKENIRGRLAMKKRLAEIPPKLGDLFRDILARDNENMNDLLLSISWILFAKRPLRLLEYHHALWAALAKSGNADEDMPDTTADDAEDCAEMCVLSSSKGLAEVTQAKKSKGNKKPDERTVQFIHESVRDYLLRDGGMNELWPDLPFDIEAQSHEQLKVCCLFYLKHHAVASLIRNLNLDLKIIGREEALLLSPKVPLLEYASQYVLFHADAAAALFPQDEALGMFSSTEWSKLFNMYEKHKNKLFKSRNSLVYMLADKGLASLVRSRIRTEAPHRKETGMRYRFPLHAAFANKDERTAAAVLDWDSLSIRFLDGPKSLIEIDNYIVELPDNSRSPLSWAAGVGLPEVVRKIIEQGVDVNESNYLGWLPLDSALKEPHGEAAHILLENGARTSNSQTLGIGLQNAARRGDMSMVKTLVSMRASMDEALCIAFAFGHENIARVLITHGAKMADPAKLEKVVLDGCRINFTKMVTHLSHGESSEAESWNANILLLLAAKVGLKPDGGLQGFDINCRNIHEETPLMVALDARNWSAAKFLLENGADVGARSKVNETALHKASRSGADEAMMGLLIDHGSDVNAEGISRLTPLHISSGRQRNETVVSLLLKHGSLVDARDKDGDTPLFKASSSSCRAVVSILLRHGADAIAVNRERCTPLAAACLRGDYSIVSELILHGCSPSIDSLSPFRAPLHLASSNGKLNIVRLLLLAGADINARDEDQRTPLHLAALGGHEAVATALLERRQCDVDAKDEFGMAPLYIACKLDHTGVAKRLLDWGASPKLPATNLIAFDIISRRDPQRVLDMLIAPGAGTVEGKAQEDPAV
jgi:ankyrin repeat protein